jgi:hypothetical protein
MEEHPILGTIAIVYAACVYQMILEIFLGEENDMTWGEKVFYIVFAPVSIVMVIRHNLKEYRRTRK